MERAALDQGFGAEHRVDGLAQRFGPVQHDQHAGVDVETPSDQIRQHRLHHGTGLGVAVGQANRVLGPVSSDNQRDDEALVGEVDAVDHQHRHVKLGQVTGQEFDHGRLGRCDEPA